MPITPFTPPAQPRIEKPQGILQPIIEGAEEARIQALERAEIAAAERIALLVAGVNFPQARQDNTLDPKKHRTYFKLALNYKTYILDNGAVDLVILLDFLTGQYRIFRKGGPKDGVVLKPQLDPLRVDNYRFAVAGALTLKSPPPNASPGARQRIYYTGVDELAEQLASGPRDDVAQSDYAPWTAAREDSFSIAHLYEKIRGATGGTVKEVHFFGHAWSNGPIIVNTLETYEKRYDKRYDKDGRVRDFENPKLAHVFDTQNIPLFRAAFASAAFTLIWGCEDSKAIRDVITVAKAKEKKGENIDRQLRQLRGAVAGSYATRLAKATGKTVYGPLPGTFSVHEGEPNDDGSGISFSPTVMHVNMEKCAHLLEFYKKHLGITFPTSGFFKGHPTFGRGYATYNP